VQSRPYKKRKEGIKESNGDGEFDQSTIYACIQISEGNPFVQYMLIKISYLIKGGKSGTYI
jgi:myo-inositol-1-phosphate synthase